MAGIPVHTSSPINPNQPSHADFPSTLAPTQVQDGPARVAASVTSSATSSQPARPGAPAMPAPTSTAANAYTPPSPTRTIPLPASTSGPPPPQPGQVPVASKMGQAEVPTLPPPKASELPRVIPPIQTQSVQPRYPPPLSASPRVVTSAFPYVQPPAGVTAIAQDLSHPPGYIQDHRASFSDRIVEPENRTHTPSPTRAGRGILDGEPVLRGDTDGTSSPVWGTAMNWAKEAGKKLSEVEGEVWKKLSGEK